MIEHLQSTVTIVTAAALISAATIAAILPLLRRHALSHPIARSSHRVPTPQGAGIGVIIATVVAAAIGLAMLEATSGLIAVFAATAILVVVGAIDDLRPIPIVPRLVLQACAVGLLLFTVPETVRLLPALPPWVERAALLVAGLWFVNLVNFMDGLDWMTVVEVVPLTVALTIFGLSGHLSVEPLIIAAALSGAYIGFAPFNRPVAKVFLGDVGSLPTGLLLAWCLLDLAARGHTAAALLLPMYYLADATVTLLRRMVGGQKFWLAHREHFYQRATDNGFTVFEIVARVFGLNVILVILAGISVLHPATTTQLAALVLGAGAVAIVLLGFARSARTKT